MVQARSTLEQTEAQIPELEISLRQANNQLCVLLGIPPEELRARLGPGHILTAPAEVAVGIPADLLRRRPDVRRAERQAAAQSAQIGVAEADFYPHISITGTISYSAGIPLLPRPAALGGPVTPMALEGNIGPTFQWNILNYGRILNNVRLQDARFQELVAAYQSTVLTAAQEVENGLVTFLQAQERAKFQAASVEDAEKAVRHRRGPVQGGDGRLHPGHPDRAEPGAVAGHARAGARRNRAGPDPGLQGPGGRLADPLDRLRDDRAAATRVCRDRPTAQGWILASRRCRPRRSHPRRTRRRR